MAMPTREVLRNLYRISGLFKARRETSRLYRQAKAQREISNLYHQVDMASKSLSNVLKDTLQDRVTPEERAWLGRIDALRKELMSSSAEVSFTDYGAGSSSVSLSDEDMYLGRVKTRTVGEIIRISGTRTGISALFLLKLIRVFKPLTCVELGTNLGFSASYQAAALKLNGKGKLVTLEGAEPLAIIARQNFRELDLDNVSVVIGRFQDTLDNVLHQQGQIDFAFIDGHHDEKATLQYLEQMYPFLSKRAVLVFDDIAWSEGMKRAWRAIEADSRVAISVDMYNWGVCIIDSEINRKQRLDYSWNRRVLEGTTKVEGVRDSA